MGSALVLDRLGVGLFTATVLVFCLVATLGPRAQGLAETRDWSLSYALYLLAVTPFGPSLIRYFMLAFAVPPPVPWAPREHDSSALRRVLWAVVALCAIVGLALQYWWTTTFFILGPDPQPWP